MEQSVLKNPVNSGNPLTGRAEGNPEPSLPTGRVVVQCANCGKELFVTPSVANNAHNKFCDRACMSEGFSKLHSGKNSPIYGMKRTKENIANISGLNHWNYGNKVVPRFQHVCQGCGTEFISTLRVHKFCSRACRWDTDRASRRHMNCAWCGKSIQRKKSFTPENTFCNHECYGAWRSKVYEQPSGPDAFWTGKRGPGTANWRGGLSLEPYGEEFHEDRKQLVRERDSFCCRLCDTPENGKKLCVHHIDYDKHNNGWRNLVSLCLPCHSRTNGDREYWTEYFQSRMRRKRIELTSKQEGVTTIPQGSTRQANGRGSAGQPTWLMI